MIIKEDIHFNMDPQISSCEDVSKQYPHEKYAQCKKVTFVNKFVTNDWTDDSTDMKHDHRYMMAQISFMAYALDHLNLDPGIEFDSEYTWIDERTLLIHYN